MRKLICPRPHGQDLSPGLASLLPVSPPGLSSPLMPFMFPSSSLRMLQTLYDYFWWERLWLPVNLTWADLEDRDGRVYAKASDLYITLPLALLFLIVRYFFEL